jgi:hypothetical protein
MNLCAPALIYVAFSLTQIVIDIFKGLYNTAFVKIIVATIIAILLNTLCQTGMGIVSWIIVFIPFIFMTIIITILLYIFGLNPTTGKLNVTCNSSTTPKGNLVFTNNPSQNKSKYVDVSYSESPLEYPSFLSSDPQYE